MTQVEYLLAVCDELKTNAELIREEEVSKASDLLLEANRLFIAGAGRSGFAARAFANRLMHLGRTVYFVGEPTTPAIREGDLLVVLSGSGETGSLKVMTQKAKKLRAKVLTMTIHPEASIGSMADAAIVIPGATPKSELGDTCTTIQPMGNAFEQMAWLICDLLIRDLMNRLQMDEEEMFSRHANLE